MKVKSPVAVRRHGAFCVVLIGSVLGFGLALPLSVVGHEGSTVLVSLNGLRLLGYRG